VGIGLSEVYVEPMAICAQYVGAAEAHAGVAGMLWAVHAAFAALSALGRSAVMICCTTFGGGFPMSMMPVPTIGVALFGRFAGFPFHEYRVMSYSKRGSTHVFVVVVVCAVTDSFGDVSAVPFCSTKREAFVTTIATAALTPITASILGIGFITCRGKSSLMLRFRFSPAIRNCVLR